MIWRCERELLHQRSCFVQERQELQEEFWIEKRHLLEKVTLAESAQDHALQAERRAISAEERCQVQQSLHQAELERLTTRYEKDLLRRSSEQARLLLRYEREKEDARSWGEWAADWKEVHDIMQPLIQNHEAAEAQRVSRQAAAQEGLNLFQQFAQLKELETRELRQASIAMRLEAERAGSRAESGAGSAEHQEQSCEAEQLEAPEGGVRPRLECSTWGFRTARARHTFAMARPLSQTPRKRRSGSQLGVEETPERCPKPDKIKDEATSAKSMWEQWGVVDYGEWHIAQKDLRGPMRVHLGDDRDVSSKQLWPIDAEYAAIGEGNVESSRCPGETEVPMVPKTHRCFRLLLWECS
eukprot:s105_g27.t1